MRLRTRVPSVSLPAVLLAIALTGGASLALAAAAPPPERARQRAVYVPAYKFPVLEEIEQARKAVQARRDSIQAAVDARYRAEKEKRKDEKVELRVDWTGIEVPPGPDAFTSAFHFPPVPQYNTGTCWAFCSTSFLESEVVRLGGPRVKLSEMWTVYWEYVEKARRFVREFGHSVVAEGSEDQGTIEIYRLYGAVPAEAYLGVLSADGRYDHEPMVAEIRSYLDWMRDNRFWDEELAIANVRMILDRYMGAPPESFGYDGREWTPREFLTDYLRLDPDDYVNVVSTLKEPFGQYVVLDVRDNWRRNDNFLNLPLDRWYAVLRDAIRAGYTASIGGDVSEPGLDGKQDAAIVPSFDIPHDYIDQSARELRIANRTTGDDHGIHVVGWLDLGGRQWYLIKDSNRSSRLGQFKGYYFYDGDYIRLKMLSYMVHKDRLEGLLP